VRRVANPPNPWSRTTVELYGEPPPAELCVHEEEARYERVALIRQRLGATRDSPQHRDGVDDRREERALLGELEREPRPRGGERQGKRGGASGEPSVPRRGAHEPPRAPDRPRQDGRPRSMSRTGAGRSASGSARTLSYRATGSSARPRWSPASA
jgi:hypothetical protein